MVVGICALLGRCRFTSTIAQLTSLCLFSHLCTEFRQLNCMDGGILCVLCSGSMDHSLEFRYQSFFRIVTVAYSRHQSALQNTYDREKEIDRIKTYTHAYIIYIHTCIHTYIHTYIHACIYTYTSTMSISNTWILRWLDMDRNILRWLINRWTNRWIMDGFIDTWN